MWTSGCRMPRRTRARRQRGTSIAMPVATRATMSRLFATRATATSGSSTSWAGMLRPIGTMRPIRSAFRASSQTLRRMQATATRSRHSNSGAKPSLPGLGRSCPRCGSAWHLTASTLSLTQTGRASNRREPAMLPAMLLKASRCNSSLSPATPNLPARRTSTRTSGSRIRRLVQAPLPSGTPTAMRAIQSPRSATRAMGASGGATSCQGTQRPSSSMPATRRGCLRSTRVRRSAQATPAT
mmetsp:Transcript_96861/g.283170  ORF Transcript_96861/g.283170 Transcript_96861/m.283170 type:complete len:240 (+) Transcript_96861:1133-1852(+)